MSAVLQGGSGRVEERDHISHDINDDITSRLRFVSPWPAVYMRSFGKIWDILCVRIDITSAWIKYSEGFIYNPLNGEIHTKPFAYWSQAHKDFVKPIDYVECIAFALQTGVFFLLQCFWSYLCNSVARRSFMSSWEFRFYIIWAIGSMAMFPILQWNYRDDIYKSEAVPQLAYGCEVLLTATLGIRSHFRFRRIINSAQAKKVATRLDYFKDVNVLLTVILYIYGACLVILCIDGLTDEMVINTNKFATDVLIANINMSSVLLWIALISIFHPRRTFTGGDTNTSNLANDEEELVSRNGRITKFVMHDATKRYNNGTDAAPAAAPLPQQQLIAQASSPSVDYHVPSYYRPTSPPQMPSSYSASSSSHQQREPMPEKDLQWLRQSLDRRG
ncbi:hypothetical protein BX666DRAFT_1570757 [Dichotomocladium elegans]|nr:hypothetical protein BX666DRAFT_1570757 [Dichotomocladium elegans]